MSEEKLAFVGKQVKDIYGTFIGRVVGIITEIDGEIESVGVDCGSSGIKQMPYEQLVVQGDYVFFIPRWRLEAQKLIRQKSLTLKRIKALQEIVAENDSMKEDAELVTLKYEKKLHDLEEIEKAVTEKLAARLAELDSETKQVRTVLFDAKLQFRSNEMKEETYQQVKIGTDELIEHITNEKTEIDNVKSKLDGLTLENISNITVAPTPAQTEAQSQAQTTDPAGTTETPVTDAKQGDGPSETPASAEDRPSGGEGQSPDGEWLHQVIQQ